MALTDDGKRLTESHRLAQLALANRAEAVGRALWPLLKVADLDASTPQWVAANVESARRFQAESTALAAAYVSEYRVAEGATRFAPVVSAPFDARVEAATLVLAGPVRVKTLIGSGTRSMDAPAMALTKFSGIVRREALQGGRKLVDLTTSRDPVAIGWRRVTDGNPCTFCAMLATRGPVYGSTNTTQGSVLRPARGGGEGLLYHGHCGCTSEIVYGEWIPTEREQEYIDNYEAAAKEATRVDGRRVAPTPTSSADTILYRMRENGIFRDSPLTRNK
jgi:hypothetical protein